MLAADQRRAPPLRPEQRREIRVAQGVAQDHLGVQVLGPVAGAGPEADDDVRVRVLGST